MAWDLYAYLEDDQLKLGDIVRVDPIFGRLTDEVLLSASSGRITLDWITLGTNKIVKLRQLDHQCIIVVVEKRLRIESRSKNWPQVPSSLFLGPIVSTTLLIGEERRLESERTSCFFMIFWKPV